VAGIGQAQDAVFIDDEVAAELGGVVAVRGVHLFSAQVVFGVEPERARAEGAQARAFQAVGGVNCPLTVEQDGEGGAGFAQPLLDGGQGAEGDDKDAGVQFGKFVLTGAQLCDMLAAGYSAKMTQKDQQGVVAVFEHFAKGDLLAGGGGQGEVGGGRIAARYIHEAVLT
jgi:hypothetical protein